MAKVQKQKAEKKRLAAIIEQDSEEMHRVREDCDQDLIQAKRNKELVKQQLDAISQEVTTLNEDYEQVKQDSRDLQLAINAAKLEIKATDRSIFELQQEIKIKQTEMDLGSDGSEDHSGAKGTTRDTADNLNMTMETIRAGHNDSCFIQNEEELAQDLDLPGRKADALNLSLEFSAQQMPPTPKQPQRQTISKNTILRSGSGSYNRFGDDSDFDFGRNNSDFSMASRQTLDMADSQSWHDRAKDELIDKLGVSQASCESCHNVLEDKCVIF